MRGLVLCLALVVAAPSPVRAQTETADLLRQAQELYERLEIERALPLLRQIVSPSWPHEITKEQRVQAYTYLGASLVLTGVRDSALLYFRGAIERDPFTDLDARRFTPAQLTLFRQARRLTFAVAVDRKSTRLNSSHGYISYALFSLKKKNTPALAEVFFITCSSRPRPVLGDITHDAQQRFPRVEPLQPHRSLRSPPLPEPTPEAIAP